MSTDRALVRNAADADQVKTANRRVSRAEAREHELVRKQLSTPDGRAYVWRELGLHFVFKSILADAPKIFVLAGIHNEGLRMLQECQRFPALYAEMQDEARARDERDARETDATHTPAATAEDAMTT